MGYTTLRMGEGSFWRMERLICLTVGYVCGCLLTAEAVARWRTGQGARALGT